MKRLVVALVALGLAGCAKTVSEMTYSERLALADEIVAQCTAQGYGRGSPHFEACAKAEIDREFTTRENNVRRRQQVGLALAAAAEGYGNSMQQQSYNRPLNCTSTPRRFNGQVTSVNTNCY